MTGFQGDFDGWTRDFFPFALGGLLGGVLGWLLRGRRPPVDGTKLNTPVYRAKSGLQPQKSLNLGHVTKQAEKGPSTATIQVESSAATVTIGDKNSAPKVSDVWVPCTVEVTGPYASNTIFAVTVRDPGGVTLGAFEIEAVPLDPLAGTTVIYPNLTTIALENGTATDLVTVELNGYLGQFTIIY